MDEKAWQHFKGRTVGRVSQQNLWGWHAQLFDALHEAYGYAELKDAGCREVRFIPETSHEAPDLEAIEATGGRILMEVKTIHESDVVQRGLRHGSALVLDTVYEIQPVLQDKLRATVCKGLRQLQSIPGPGRRVLLLFVWMDFNTESAWGSVSHFVTGLQTPGVEIDCRQIGPRDLKA